MYGDLRKAGDCQLEVLEFGTPIPYEVIVKQFKQGKFFYYFSKPYA